MSASIVISDLSWSWPDGTALFQNLKLSFGPERAGLVGRNGTGKSTLLRLIAGALPTGAITVAGRLAVLRQSVQVREGESIADLFGVAGALALLRRAEQGLATANDLAAADWTLEARLMAALSRLGLEAAPATPLASLSGGQRTRAGLAALVFAEPDFLLLDEPTNNLDRGGREAVAGLLAEWRKGAIVVSHDRELLEGMDAIVELTSLGATRYGGGFSHYRAQKALELAAAGQQLTEAQKRLAALAEAAQASAERKARKDGAGRKKAARGGAPRLLLGAMKAKSEATSGSNALLAGRRHEQAQAAAAAARRRIEVLQPMTVTLPPTGLAAGRQVLRLEDVTTGYVPGQPVLRNLDFAVTGPQRIAVSGSNGAGKTTLLEVIAGRLLPWSGRVKRPVSFALLDQSADILDPAASIRDNFRRINPQADENACRAALARFMFRADAALQSVASLSGGQMLRAGLACVLGSSTPPPLLMLDEPTNHLDISSMEAVEAGLRAYDGALLIVSHDEAFLAAVRITRRLELQRFSMGR
jgi:ATPase subunit of ABC transporter with duplicated ATPase domains